MTDAKTFVFDAGYGTVLTYKLCPGIFCPGCGVKGHVYEDDREDYYHGNGFACVACGAAGIDWDDNEPNEKRKAQLVYARTNNAIPDEPEHVPAPARAPAVEPDPARVVAGSAALRPSSLMKNSTKTKG